MSARRPRSPIQADPPPTSDTTETGSSSSSSEVGSTAGRVIAYASIRCRSNPGKIRHSVSALLIEASRDQSIEFHDAPYPHFRVMPGGTEIPLSNVAGAVPVQSQIAEKASRKERLAKRAENLKEKMGERAAQRPKPVAPKNRPKNRPKIQDVPEEVDDIDDSLDDDEVEDDAEPSDVE